VTGGVGLHLDVEIGGIEARHRHGIRRIGKTREPEIVGQVAVEGRAPSGRGGGEVTPSRIGVTRGLDSR
jgi:hypothetical protein